MRRPHLRRLVRTPAVLGLLALLILPSGLLWADDLAPAAPVPVGETVSILDAQKAGLVEVSLRGAGEDRVRMALHNHATRPLRVVLPAGLVASAGAAQFGGFQSMGLSAPSDSPNAFGAFRDSQGGFRSVAVRTPGSLTGLALDAGQTLELAVPSICLNYGLPTPTSRDRFELVDVENYTTDLLRRKALRTLATLGTSQKVAQAVVWNVFNGLSFPQMAAQASRKLNVYELTLAAQFVQTLDASGPGDVIEPAYLQQNRLFVRLNAGANVTGDLTPLADQLATEPLLGLPVMLVNEVPSGEALLSAMMVDVQLTAITPSQIRGRMAVGYRTPQGAWKSLGNAEFETPQDATDGAALAETLDRALAESFVRTKVMRRDDGSTVLAIENRLPFTLTDVLVPRAEDARSELHPLNGLGLSPARSMTATLPDPAVAIQKVVCNGL